MSKNSSLTKRSTVEDLPTAASPNCELRFDGKVVSGVRVVGLSLNDWGKLVELRKVINYVNVNQSTDVLLSLW
jgi:hypothetical protein